MTEVKAPKIRQRLHRGLAGLSGVAVLATSLIGVGMPSAVAAPETFNPFSINSGFTVLTTGDVELNNSELEGSIAAFGSIASGSQNYPVVHKVAGQDDYTVPSIDGKPVRILANQFVGTGNFDLTNAGAPDAAAPEANAVAKLVDLSNVTAAERGGFVRLKNADSDGGETGNLDLKSLLYAGHSPSDYAAERDSVEAYFPGVATHVTQTNQCLAALQAPDTTVANHVTVADESGMAFVEGFATDKPNLINYEDVAGKTIKMDPAGGYKPTAQAPLVVKVSAATTSLGKLNFEGWNASAGADQVLSRYIFIDASEVTGTLTVNGLEMGAIWAPDALINFDSNVTTNGQWFSNGVLTAGSGEVHHHTFLGVLPCVTSTEPVLDPSIGTTVAVAGSDAKVLPLTGGTVIDTVAYENLTVGVEYTLEGELFVAATGVSTKLTASATFTPSASNGSTTVTFTLSAEDVAAFAGQDLVVFEYLSLDGDPVAEHADLDDEAQTFTVDEEPSGEIPGEPGEETPGEPGDETPEDPRESDGVGLAVTGAEVTYVAGAAALLLVAGISLLMMRRRRA